MATRILMVVTNRMIFRGSVEAKIDLLSVEQCNNYGDMPTIVESTLDQVKPPAFYEWAKLYDEDTGWKAHANNLYTRLMTHKNNFTKAADARLEVTFVWVDVEL